VHEVFPDVPVKSAILDMEAPLPSPSVGSDARKDVKGIVTVTHPFVEYGAVVVAVFCHGSHRAIKPPTPLTILTVVPFQAFGIFVSNLKAQWLTESAILATGTHCAPFIGMLVLHGHPSPLASPLIFIAMYVVKFPGKLASPLVCLPAPQYCQLKWLSQFDMEPVSTSFTLYGVVTEPNCVVRDYWSAVRERGKTKPTELPLADDL